MANVNKKISTSIIHLNVGGKLFATTRETLQGAGFFTPWLAGRFDMACDEDGNVFIDRDGHLSAHEYSRSGTSLRSSNGSPS